ncbi:hypothetical protein MRX96_004721 [Rhipicephalus microplus]
MDRRPGAWVLMAAESLHLSTRACSPLKTLVWVKVGLTMSRLATMSTRHTGSG